MAKKERKRSEPTYPKKSKAERKKARVRRIEKRDAAVERIYQEGERLGREWRSRNGL